MGDDLDSVVGTPSGLVWVRSDRMTPFTTSEIIAQHAGIQHKNLLELIARYEEQLASICSSGAIAFQTRSNSAGQIGGRDTRYVELTEPQATLLITFCKNTARVVDFKVRLVSDFYRMREELERVRRPVALPSKRELAMMLIESEDAREAAEAQLLAVEERVREIEPKARVAEHFLIAKGDLPVKDVSSLLQRKVDVQLGQNQLFERLREMGWIYRGRADGRWRPMQAYIIKGWVTAAPQRHRHPRTGEWVEDRPQVRITEEGQYELMRVLSQ